MQKGDYMKKLKRLQSWKVRGLKELKKVNSLIAEQFLWLHICWSSSRTKVENIPIRMNGNTNSCDFWKKCNGYWQNIYILSNRRHCWTLWCLFYFCRVKNEGGRVRDKKFRLKINIAAYKGVAGVLVALGLLQPKVYITSCTGAHAIHTNYKIRRQAKSP